MVKSHQVSPPASEWRDQSPGLIREAPLGWGWALAKRLSVRRPPKLTR